MERTEGEQLKQRRSDAGETLLEVLLAMIILGGAIAALLGGLATGIISSSRHRDLATANTVLRSYAEAVKQTARTSYVNCANKYTVPTNLYTIPAGWSVPDNAVSGSTCPASDNGIQTVTITVTSPQNVHQTLSIIVRKP